ncbi:hypothetical protein A7X67_04335 [Clostridium sp. W14A]|nr:hypothetical protein A7X67_04335 [Clostridium sp. W14A]
MCEAGFRADGCLDAFAGGLPVADVIRQLIHMRIKTLLPFLGAPDFNAVVYEPFHDKRCFVLAASQPVKHEDQKNIKFF